MKKILSLVLAMTLLISISAGCTFTGDNNSTTKATTASSQSQTGEGGTDNSDTTNASETKDQTLGADQTFVYSQASDPQKYDPRNSVGLDQRNIINQIFTGLVRQNIDGTIHPSNALSWEVNEDMTVYTFTLDPKVTWSDGQPVVAQDYVYAWTTALDPTYPSRIADTFYIIKNAEKVNKEEVPPEELGVKAIDEYTLEVTMENGNPLFIEQAASISMAPVRKDMVEKYSNPEEWSLYPESCIGNGPFKMAANEPKQYVELVKNESYIKAAEVKATKVKVLFIEEATTALASFKTGAVDICTTLPAIEIADMLEAGTAKVSPMLATYYYSFNMSDTVKNEAVKEAFAKIEVRRALSLAIDREAIVTAITKAGQVPSVGMVPHGVLMPDKTQWTDKSDYVAPKADLETAKKLLAEAGYPNGEGFPKFQIFYNTNESHQAIAQAVQDMWKQGLGINVELVNKETKIFSEERGIGQFEMARSGDTNRSGILPRILDKFVTENIERKNNDPRYSNPEYDELIKKASADPSIEKRLEYYRQAEDIIMKDMPVIPIYSYVNVLGIQTDVKGLYQSTSGDVYFEGLYRE